MRNYFRKFFHENYYDESDLFDINVLYSIYDLNKIISFFIVINEVFELSAEYNCLFFYIIIFLQMFLEEGIYK